MNDMLKDLNPDKLPLHVAIIMDGNGRWAQQHGHERTFGHQNAIEAVRSTIEGAAEMGVRFLTLYTFSTENWNRPQEEVELLMGLLAQSVHNELDNLLQNHVRLMVTGRMDDLPASCRELLQHAIDVTSHNDGLTLILALSYSGRSEIVDMVRRVARKVQDGLLSPDDISDSQVVENLYHGEVPDPDIMIRTGGDCRISNFLLWQSAYTEFFFVPTMWPDFRKTDLHDIIVKFQTRERRFGKTGEQVREK